MAWIKRFFGAADITIDSESGALRTHDDHAAEKIRQALLGTGLPIKLPIIDPGDDGWSAALQPNPITRDCTRLRMIVKDSGFNLSPFVVSTSAWWPGTPGGSVRPIVG